MDRTHMIAGEVIDERYRQDKKWGEQNHPDGTSEIFRSHADMWREECDFLAENGEVHWRAILLEEAYEAFAETDPKKLRAELIQVAAVACAWVECIDRRSR